MQNTKPILRWAGSKRAALPYLKKYCDWNFSRYIEPFCGSAALFFKIGPKQAILSDLNPDLISFYKHCKTRHGVVWNIANSLPIEEDTYYEIRSEYNSISSSVRKSGLFLYLNRACFNGIYRTNQRGGFNVPFSGKKVAKFPSYENFKYGCSLLNNVELQSVDFETIIRSSVKEGDLIFMDPPYATSKKRTFAEYDKGSFKTEDIARVIHCMHFIEEKGAKFVCTYDGQEYEKFDPVSKWLVDSFEVTRNVGGFLATRKKAKEVIFSNIRI